MSARRAKPAGAPEDWEKRRPAGSPAEHSEAGDDRPAGDPAARVDPDPGPARDPAARVDPDPRPARDPVAPVDPDPRPARDPAAPGVGDEEAAGSHSVEAARVDADLDALLADVKRERDEYLDLAQRARADFENYRRRAAGESAAAEHRGKAALARKLVPSLDNLERALRAAGVDPDPRSAAQPHPATYPAAPVLPDPRPARDPVAHGVEDEEATGGGSGEAAGPGSEEATGSGSAGPRSEQVSAHEALARGVALVYQELLATLAEAGVERYDPAGERFDPAWHEALSTRAVAGTEPGLVLETLEKGYRLDGQVIRAARVVVSE